MYANPSCPVHPTLKHYIKSIYLMNTLKPIYKILLFCIGGLIVTIPQLWVIAQEKVSNIENKQDVISFAGYIIFTGAILLVIGGVITLITVVVKLTNTINGIKATHTSALAELGSKLSDDITKNREAISELAAQTSLSILANQQGVDLLKKDVENNQKHFERVQAELARKINQVEGWGRKEGYHKRHEGETIE